MKIGLALSGGGSRGISHLGFLQAFKEAGITFSMVTGTSAGAIIGLFHCYGYEPNEILHFIKSIKPLRYFRPAISKSGLIKMDALRPLFESYIEKDDFSALKIPLVVASTSVQEGKNVFFYEGEVIKPVMASAAVPVVFDPIEINGRYFIDGGILNNLPVEPLVGHVDRILGINSNPISGKYQLGNIKSLMERSLLMAINVNTYSKRALCDMFLEAPEMAEFGAFELSKADEMFEIGYNNGLKHIDNIKSWF